MELEGEVLWSICLNYLRDPVAISCDHVFCYRCIIQVWKSIRHVWQMASLVGNIWRVKVDEERQPREDAPLQRKAEKLCGLHLEKLHYYCEDDQQILCVMCRESQERRHHPEVLPEKAAHSYQGRVLPDPSFTLIAKKFYYGAFGTR
ncbi:tripartite motif-containing protein 26 [Prionailurus iriomotensis]